MESGNDGQTKAVEPYSATRPMKIMGSLENTFRRFIIFLLHHGAMGSPTQLVKKLIPQHLAEENESKERTIRVTGDKMQIETARELIKEVMNQVFFPPNAYFYHKKCS